MSPRFFGPAIVALALAIALSGCAKKDQPTAVTTPDGTVTVEQSDETKVTVEKSDETKVTLTDEKGETTAELGRAVDPGALGIEFYPNSTELADQGASFDSPEAKTTMVTLETSDAPSAVAAFYKPLLHEAQVSELEQEDMKIVLVAGKLETGAQVTVSASQKPDEKTRIQISVVADKTKQP